MNIQPSYDVILIGAGHNGLVAAAYLAKAGLRVMVLERRQMLGGAAATEDVFAGFRVNTGACDAGLFLPKIVDDLELEDHGLELIQPPALIFALQLDNRALTLWRDTNRTIEEIARFSQADARNWLRYLHLVSRLAEILQDMLTLLPPPIPKYTLSDLLPWLPLALKVKRLGKSDLREFMRLLPMSAIDFLDEWFETPALKAALGVAGVNGSLQGPRASGTAFMLLYHAIGAGEVGFRAVRFVRQGTGFLSEALAAAARKHGAEIFTGKSVSKLILDDGRAIGVILESGEKISGRIVLSSANPRHTFFELVGAPNLPLRFVREVKNIKFRGSTARVNLALNGLPRFDAAPDGEENLSGHILVCQDLDYLERAYDAAKYGEFSPRPCLDVVIPTLADPSLAPPGAHLMCIDVRYAPYHLRDGDWDSRREGLSELVVETLAAYAPGLRDLIIDRQVLTPLDLERRFSLPEGNIYHGQMGLDQLLFMRPVAGSQGARTPIQNLYLCGAGVHPGGGLTGAPGYNAARQVLQDLRS